MNTGAQRSRRQVGQQHFELTSQYTLAIIRYDSVVKRDGFDSAEAEELRGELGRLADSLSVLSDSHDFLDEFKPDDLSLAAVTARNAADHAAMDRFHQRHPEPPRRRRRI